MWPINRSITGEGVRETLLIIKDQYLPAMTINEIPTGTKVFDWVIPKEWNVREAFIITPSGQKICNFSDNNLHLVGYSTPIRKKISMDDLNTHLYSIPEQPDAIPYITSYYEERWGFCLSHNQRIALEEGEYEVVINADLLEGSLTYGELIIKGDSSKEVFISTYICHPSMANNELSGPTVTTFIAMWLESLAVRKHTYRIIFIPETIGSIAYLCRHLETLKKNVVAGFNVTCIGDDRSYSYLPSRQGNTISDVVIKHILKWIDPTFKSYKWSDRGSDERQYCSPGVDLPIASIMRTKYGEYPEYHTSLDDLINVVTKKGLDGGFNALRCAIEAIEKNCYPKTTVLCEPKLDKYGLYPTLSSKGGSIEVRLMKDLITWSDGTKSLIEIAEECDVPVWILYPIIDKLLKYKILSVD